MRSLDRILVLEKIDPDNRDIGLIDPKTLAGKNPLHLYRDADSGMWFFKYEHGVIPPALRSKFTDFRTAKLAAEQYLSTKNIRITQVID